MKLLWRRWQPLLQVQQPAAAVVHLVAVHCWSLCRTARRLHDQVPIPITNTLHTHIVCAKIGPCFAWGLKGLWGDLDLERLALLPCNCCVGWYNSSEECTSLTHQ